MTNTKQELIAIRDGAPNDGTMYIAVGGDDYIGDCGFYENGGARAYVDEHTRSLADIDSQIKLIEENEALEARVAELEEENRRLIIARNEKGEKNGKLKKRIAELERELEHSKCDSLSQDAMESLEAMVHYCLNNEIAMGMDGGYEKDGSKKAFRKEIEDAFNYWTGR